MLLILLLSVTATNYQVSIGPGNMFSPQEVDADVGDTVSWTLNEPYSVTQVSSECSGLAGGFASVKVPSMQVYSHTFKKSGQYQYVSQKHCQKGMRGIVNVKELIAPPKPEDIHIEIPVATETFDQVVPTIKIPEASPTFQPTSTLHKSKPHYRTSNTPVVSHVPVTHTIQVAPSGELAYSVPNIKVQVGDSIIWKAGKKNHTVTQVDSKSSCVKSASGFNSGLIIDPNSFTQVFNTIGKIWYTCIVPGHCQAGMRGFINVVSNGSPPSGASSVATPTTDANYPVSPPNATGSPSINSGESQYFSVVVLVCFVALVV